MDTGEDPRRGVGLNHRRSGGVRNEQWMGIGRDRGGTHTQGAEVRSRLSDRDRLTLSERWPSRIEPMLVTMAEMVGAEMKAKWDRGRKRMSGRTRERKGARNDIIYVARGKTERVTRERKGEERKIGEKRRKRIGKGIGKGVWGRKQVVDWKEEKKRVGNGKKGTNRR